MHRIGTHVGNQRDRAFVAQLHAFIELLREGHGALGGVAQPVISRLLQFRSREGRRRIALLFFLRNACHLPLGLADRADDLIRGFLILYFDVLAFVLEELGFEERRLPGIQHRVNRPILLRNERANLLLALDDQPQGHRLDAPGGEAAPNFVPENRRNLVAHNAIEHAACLLRIH